MEKSGVDFYENSLSLKDSVDYSDNSVVSKTILDKKAGTLTLFAFDHGQKLSEHTAPYDATILVTDGEGEIIINNNPHIVKAGEMIIMPANVPHAVNAQKKFKMMLIMIRE